MEHQPQPREEATADPSRASFPPAAVQPPQGEQDGQEQQPLLEAEPEIQPRIYVASLSDYNAGRLHGIWLDANQDPDALHDAIQGMLGASPTGQAEEWAIHDFEGFNGLHLGEWEDLAHVSRVAHGIRQNGVAFAHWTMLAASDDELDRFEDAYLGHWPSLSAYAEDYLADSGLEHAIDQVVPESLQPYVTIDADALGRDLELSGDVTTFDGDSGVYIFRSTW